MKYALISKDNEVISVIEAEEEFVTAYNEKAILENQKILISAPEGVETGWVFDGEGVNFLPPVEDFTALSEQIRTQRNSLLSKSDWTQAPDSQVDKAAWSTYRQALRDIPQQADFPLTVVWPNEP
tara:strand:+ start:317 stop:691 length:375 start_codon:yes stop_codon:yes gene_type:complete